MMSNTKNTQKLEYPETPSLPWIINATFKKEKHEKLETQKASKSRSLHCAR